MISNNVELFKVLRSNAVPFVIVGGHAVTFHGYERATEDTDVVWHRSPEAEDALLNALGEIDACYIGKEIDPNTRMERTYPVTLGFVRSRRLMMLVTKFGFLDLFDYVPGLPDHHVAELFAASVESDGLRYASLADLRRMKAAAGRSKDLIDLQNLPGDSEPGNAL